MKCGDFDFNFSVAVTYLLGLQIPFLLKPKYDELFAL
jgi:hypothetical protein